MARHPGIVVGVLSWNLAHGRDFPPDASRRGLRARLLRRPLLDDFAGWLASREWELALLQEAPPRWQHELAGRARASSAAALTSRNSFPRLRAALADRIPDLIASNEGGSNQLLVRAPWRVAETRVHTLTCRPERRRMLWARLEGPASLAVANLHGSVDSVPGAREQVLRAAELAVGWSGELPLIFGGDLNLRVTRQPDLFEELAARFGLAAPTSRTAIDHLLVRGMDTLEAPRAGPMTQLSDHAYVTSMLGMR
jgi:endonuclease/exonuclease/phosphatase family metal-dependent hydrolase